jgi:hypothetical protein
MTEDLVPKKGYHFGLPEVFPTTMEKVSRHKAS